MQLEDRLYTSTEVAEILGVSLRSVYRYMEEDKLSAEIKTATGRHRFTRRDILDFLYPEGEKGLLYEEDGEKTETKKSSQQTQKQQTQTATQTQSDQPAEEPAEETKAETATEDEEEPVDWLEKFREAAKKYKEEQVEQPAQQAAPQQPQPQPQPTPQPQPAQQPTAQTQQQTQTISQPVQQQPQQQTQQGPSLMYYRSMLGGLKEIAQNLDKGARNSDMEYAFTLSAGASLHKPIKPFATLHSYIRPSERDFFEKLLRLSPSNETNAQLCLILSDDGSVFNNRKEVHGLYVVSDKQLKEDINKFGDAQLAQEMADVL